MNREQLLNELVQTLERWPSTPVECEGKGAWSLRVCRGEIQYRNDNYSSITEQDWEKSRLAVPLYNCNVKYSVSAPPVIPDDAERVTIVKGEVVYLKHQGHKVWQFKNGEWLNDLKLNEAVQLWDKASPLAKPPTPPNDAVHQPKHYGVLDGVESIQIIASSMTRDEWRGFCMGNIMKYRMRAGKKDALQQDIDKANEYEMLFDKYKELNRAKR